MQIGVASPRCTVDCNRRGQSTGLMRDPANPTDAELTRWAFSDEPQPIEDFDLVVADVERVPLLLELTSSPQRPFFMRCLYLIVGDAVRTAFKTSSRSAVQSALEVAIAVAASDRAVARWAEDSQTLLASPERFDYDDRCDGGLARRAVAASPDGD